MTIRLIEELGGKCWYCGGSKVIHQKFPECEINACRSCSRLGGKDGLEEFRVLLGERKAARKIAAKTSRRPVKTGEGNHTIEELLWRTLENIQEYKFYFEELAQDFSAEVENVNNIMWHDAKPLSGPDLLKELGSKCWYCGKLLCRHKQQWRDVRIPLGQGRYVEGIELAKVTPYYGRPTHDNFEDFMVNACLSCKARRHRKPIEEYRRWLGARVMRDNQELQSLQLALASGIAYTDGERRIKEQRLQELRATGDEYMFYVEELIFRCGRAWNAQNRFQF